MTFDEVLFDATTAIFPFLKSLPFNRVLVLLFDFLITLFSL